MVTDCHVHLFLEKNDMGSCDREVDRLLDCMKRNGIDKACLIPMVFGDGSSGYFPDKTNILFAAQYLADLLKSHKEHFYSLIWVNGSLDSCFLTGMTEKYILGGAINGIKFCNEVNAADNKLEPFADFLESRDVPVLFHSWYNSQDRSFCESSPSDIAILAERHPGLRIIMAHLTGCRFRGIQDIKKHPNVSVDTSGSWPEDAFLAYALKELGPDRILYGSDYPGRDFAVQLSRMDSVELLPEVKNKLLYRNAERFFEGRLNIHE